jgi:hypothetical protein
MKFCFSFSEIKMATKQIAAGQGGNSRVSFKFEPFLSQSELELFFSLLKKKDETFSPNEAKNGMEIVEKEPPFGRGVWHTAMDVIDLFLNNDVLTREMFSCGLLKGEF